MEFFEPVFQQARELSNSYIDSETSKVPFVTVSICSRLAHNSDLLFFFLEKWVWKESGGFIT